MESLYSEIIDVLSAHGKTLMDIDWIECSSTEYFNNQTEVTLDNFIEAAQKTVYDTEGYNHDINPTLILYGKNKTFIIVIDEYDGKMSPQYISFPDSKPAETHTFNDFYSKDRLDSILIKRKVCE